MFCSQNGKDGQTKGLARKIIAAQESEIATIDAGLKTKGARTCALATCSYFFGVREDQWMCTMRQPPCARRSTIVSSVMESMALPLNVPATFPSLMT